MANSHPESIQCVQMLVNSKETSAENRDVNHRAKRATAEKQASSLSPIHSTHILLSDLGV